MSTRTCPSAQVSPGGGIGGIAVVLASVSVPPVDVPVSVPVSLPPPVLLSPVVPLLSSVVVVSGGGIGGRPVSVTPPLSPVARLAPVVGVGAVPASASSSLTLPLVVFGIGAMPVVMLLAPVVSAVVADLSGPHALAPSVTASKPRRTSAGLLGGGVGLGGSLRWVMACHFNAASPPPSSAVRARVRR